MKEAYLTESTRQRAIESMLSTVREHGLQRSIPFEPSRAALLIIDMQRYFLDPDAPAFLPAGPAIVPVVQSLRDAFVRASRPVFFTRHIDADSSDNALARWWQTRITKNDPFSGIVPELDQGVAQVLPKSEYDAFHETSLHKLLLAGGVTQVVICGVLTNLCCETTARAAFVRGFDVFFTADATATNNREMHLSTLLNLAHGFATLRLSDDISKDMAELHEA